MLTDEERKLWSQLIQERLSKILGKEYKVLIDYQNKISVLCFSSSEVIDVELKNYSSDRLLKFTNYIYNSKTNMILPSGIIRVMKFVFLVDRD